MAEEEKKSKKVELTQVSTGSAVAYKVEGDIMTTEELLVWMANKLERIERSVA